MFCTSNFDEPEPVKEVVEETKEEEDLVSRSVGTGGKIEKPAVREK